MEHFPFIVLPASPPAGSWRNFATRRGAVAYARVAANRRRVAYVVWLRTATGVRLVRRQEPDRQPLPEED